MHDDYTNASGPSDLEGRADSKTRSDLSSEQMVSNYIQLVVARCYGGRVYAVGLCSMSDGD